MSLILFQSFLHTAKNKMLVGQNPLFMYLVIVGLV